MEITVRGKHYDVPDHVEARARRKFGRLEHYLPLLRDAAVEVDLAQERTKEPHHRYLVHVSVSAHGVHLQAEERAARPEEAVDLAARVLAGQARRHKQRLYGRGRGTLSKEVTSQLAEAASPPGPKAARPGSRDSVARVKRFPVQPMTTDEAVKQMEVLGHDFYLFFNVEVGQLALLYRRRAGNYGLILPELS